MTFYSDALYQRIRYFFAEKQTDTRSRGKARELAKKFSATELEVEQIIKDLISEGALSGHYPHGMLKCHLPEPVSEEERRLSDVLDQYPGAEVLIANYGALKDWGNDQLHKLVAGLFALKQNLPVAYELTRYQASAKYLLGASKVLDALDKRSLQLFGIDKSRFKEAVSYMVIAGPAEPEQVLLIENPQSFEACIQVGLHQHIGLVSTYGYGLLWKEAVEHLDSVTGIVRAGHTELTLNVLLNHPQLFFWGDLDHAGMDIFEKIKTRLPQCQLSQLYQPLIQRLEAGNRHPYTRATGKQSQPAEIKKLSHALAVDQESLTGQEILLFYKGPLSEALTVHFLSN